MNRLTRMWNTFLRGLGELSPSCREATRLQSRAMERPPGFRQKIGLRIHLLLCRWCRRYGRQIAFLRNAAHEHSDKMVEPVPQKLSDEARERIRQILHAKKDGL
jgi:hypothetical protein